MINLDPNNSRGIVWLASYPKSGNTWVRAFVHALYHTIVGNPLEEVDINRMNDFTRSDRDTALYAKYLSGPATEVDPQEIAVARPKVQADIARTVNGPIMLKTHNARVEDRGVPLINDSVSAGAVYVIRNPLDVAVSFARFRRVSIDRAVADMAEEDFGMETSAKSVYYITTSWSEHVGSWTGETDPSIHVVRYEDMAEKPVETFSALAEHILMPHTRAQLDQAITLASFERLQRTEKKAGFWEKSAETDLFFREGRAGGWRKALTDKQVQRMVDAHGEQMGRFGYLP